jgi:hypothetical protein
MSDEEIQYTAPGPDAERVERTARVVHVESGEAKPGPRRAQVKRQESGGPADLRSVLNRSREEAQRVREESQRNSE